MPCGYPRCGIGRAPNAGYERRAAGVFGAALHALAAGAGGSPGGAASSCPNRGHDLRRYARRGRNRQLGQRRCAGCTDSVGSGYFVWLCLPAIVVYTVFQDLSDIQTRPLTCSVSRSAASRTALSPRRCSRSSCSGMRTRKSPQCRSGRLSCPVKQQTSFSGYKICSPYV